MDTVWVALFSGAVGGLITALINTWISHRLAKSRDTANREGNEEIQRNAEARHERTRDDHEREAQQEIQRKERLQAVTSYYVAYTEAFRTGSQSNERRETLLIATRIFRLEAMTLDHEMETQVGKILDLMGEVDRHFAIRVSSYGQRAHLVLEHLEPLQEPLFKELMHWGLHGQAWKVSKLLDQELAALKDK